MNRKTLSPEAKQFYSWIWMAMQQLQAKRATKYVQQHQFVNQVPWFLTDWSFFSSLMWVCCSKRLLTLMANTDGRE